MFCHDFIRGHPRESAANKRAHDDVRFSNIKREPWCGQPTTLTAVLFVLAALFVRAAVTASARVEAAPALAILAALLLAALAGRTIILWTPTGGLLRASPLAFVHTTLLSQILFPVVCHIYSSLVV